MFSSQERARLRVLRSHHILDTAREEVFDRNARMAAHHFGTPIAAVSFMDENRLWFKAIYGLELNEAPRDIAFCDYTVRERAVVVIPDTRLDERFRQNALVVGPPFIRFYAGAPVFGALHYCLGTVAIMDVRPRAGLSDADQAFLADIAAAVGHELEMRLAAAKITQEAKRRRHAERKFAEASERFRLAVQHSPVILWTEDADLRCTWIVNLPPPFERQDFIGKRCEEIFSPELAAELNALKRRAMADGIVRSEILLSLGGQQRRYDVTFEAIRRGGKVVGVSGAGVDVTEHFEAQQMLNRALTKAKAADSAKARFIAAASHDLRQPVQSLSLLLGVLQQRLEQHPAAAIAASANESLRALRGLLDSLLDISRLEAGLITSKLAPVAMRPLLERLASEYRLQAEAKGLAFRVRAPEAFVLTDSVLLERVLRNLIENAIRYTGSGAVLLVCRRHEGHVHVQVIDTGPGIPAAQLDQVFEEFVQLSNPERDRRKGLGLGLAIVRRLVDLMGHKLEVRSNLGRGTRFSVEMSTAATIREEAAATERRRELRGRVLVIDDEAQVAHSLALALEQAGLEVTTADSAESALSAGEVPDAIVADYRLREGHTGVEAVQALSGHYGHPIPALLITGDTSPDRLLQAEASGLPILHKPVAMDDLIENVARLIH